MHNPSDQVMVYMIYMYKCRDLDCTNFPLLGIPCTARVTVLCRTGANITCICILCTTLYNNYREAARECRRKKKEYVRCLENRVAVLESQNQALIGELRALKELYLPKSQD